MFKQLKIRLNLIYLISIAIILGLSLTVIYTSTYRSTFESVGKRLDVKNIATTGVEDNEQRIPVDRFEPLDTQGSFNDEIIVENNEQSLETIIEENIGSGYEINDDNLITNGEEYYAYKQLETQTKLIDVSKEISFLMSFKANLIRIFFLIMSFAAIFGYFFIKQIIRPVAQSYDLQKQFVADASHELKTPLAVLKSCLSLIAKGDSESQELIEYSQMEVSRLSNLTSKLLKLSENPVPAKDIIDISHQTNLILSGVEVQLFEKQINFTSQVKDNLQVNITAEEYSQLIHILIDNACKYNDKRQKVKLELSEWRSEAHLIVSNTSDYVSEGDLEKLFERFYREDKSRNKETKGFGLGLSIASHIVNTYKGSIEATYDNSRFKIIIKLPIKRTPLKKDSNKQSTD